MLRCPTTCSQSDSGTNWPPLELPLAQVHFSPQSARVPLAPLPILPMHTRVSAAVRNAVRHVRRLPASGLPLPPRASSLPLDLCLVPGQFQQGQTSSTDICLCTMSGSFCPVNNEMPDFPVIQLPGYQHPSGWTFHDLHDDIAISKHAEIIHRILALSNGSNTSDEIIRQISSDHNSVIVSSVLKELSDLGILCDKTRLYRHFHRLSNNPTTYHHDLGADEIERIERDNPFLPARGVLVEDIGAPCSLIASAAAERVSVRNFCKDPVGSGKLVEAVRTAYSASLRPVPSAGGLYPLRLNVLVRHSTSPLREGLYQFDHQTDRLIVRGDLDVHYAKVALNSDTFLYGAASIFTISADLDRLSDKYSNRGYRFVLLEAGHVAQMLMLSLSSHGISSLEYGGFTDESLKRFLRLQQSEWPLICVAVGYADRGCDDVRQPSASPLLRLSPLIGPTRPVRNVSSQPVSHGTGPPTAYRAHARYVLPNEDELNQRELSGLGHGIGTSLESASLKAIAEAFERHSSHRLRIDLIAAADTISDEWIDPRRARPFTPQQLNQINSISTFETDKEIQWVEGTRVSSGSRAFVPVDMVYYPLSRSQLGRGLIANADSSGMAAHFERDEAIVRATMELIERDAMLRSWYRRSSPPLVDAGAMSYSVGQRIMRLADDKFDIAVQDISEYGAAVANVVVRNRENAFPCFFSGAAASETSFETATMKALDEVEQGLTSIRQYSHESRPLSPTEVRSPLDHGRLYLHPGYQDTLAWMWEGELSRSPPDPHSRAEILELLDPVIIDLGDGSDVLCVVRAICPSLVPIGFGYGAEYYSHEAIVPGLKQTPSLPHYFA